MYIRPMSTWHWRIYWRCLQFNPSQINALLLLDVKCRKKFNGKFLEKAKPPQFLLATPLDPRSFVLFATGPPSGCFNHSNNRPTPLIRCCRRHRSFVNDFRSLTSGLEPRSLDRSATISLILFMQSFLDESSSSLFLIEMLSRHWSA